jgi:hypothetical protein
MGLRVSGKNMDGDALRTKSIDDEFAPTVVAETTRSLRQMSVGEAVMELDLRDGEVVVFRHAGHGGLNVVYRRADGNIGWIDPALRANQGSVARPQRN